jgi:hypothetical protein
MVATLMRMVHGDTLSHLLHFITSLVASADLEIAGNSRVTKMDAAGSPATYAPSPTTQGVTQNTTAAQATVVCRCLEHCRECEAEARGQLDITKSACVASCNFNCTLCNEIYIFCYIT